MKDPDQFIPVRLVLDRALNLGPWGRAEAGEVSKAENARIARARAAAVVGGGGLPELHVAKACEAAGVPLETRITIRFDEPGVGISRTREPYVPAWVAPFYEATITQSAQQVRVLKRANGDPEWRAAGLSVWHLGGLEALVTWLDGAR